MLNPLLVLVSLGIGLAISPPIGGNGNPFIDKYLASAHRHLDTKDFDSARADIEHALERDHQHLDALKLLADVAVLQNDLDAAIYALNTWIRVYDSAEKPPRPKADRKAVLALLLSHDSEAETFLRISTEYTQGLLKLAKEHRKKGRNHSALELYQEVLNVDRLNREARIGISDVRRKGGSDVAVEDMFAGAEDPTAGIDPETIAELEAAHSTWATAFEGETENYRYRTDASYLVFKTAPIAMEQMNRAYRQFFQYKLDGDPTPKIGVYIYKDRAEYLKENGLPENDWTGGFFNGSTVQTYIGGSTGTESIREMYGTLFHEAAHQFVSLTGRGGIPGWLNEAYASFFEGTTILSNGSVRWNQVPNHRLFPLASRMEKGWMASGRDASPDAEGNWTSPEGAPTFRIVVTGDYQWGPPWYAPTWGVVYFLYNYRDEKTGEPVYREALHNYYLSGPRGRPDPIGHFEELVLQGAPLSPVEDIDALNDIWERWILNLRDIQLGKKKSGKSNAEYGDLAMERGDSSAALGFYEEAYLHMSEDPEVVWKLATALEKSKELDRALALYVQFARELELRGLSEEDERYPVALEKMGRLDPLFRRQEKLKKTVQEEGMALARSYRDRGMPSMAMEIARLMSANFSMPEALSLYAEVARSTGKSLAKWKIAYNEFDLEGWSGSQAYRAYGKMIEAAVVNDATIVTAEGQFQTQELACDVTFDADFSLEAEMRFGEDASLMGLCFGRKDSQNFNAVVLHPKGYLDISTQNGGTWLMRDHRSARLSMDWHTLRIDVVQDLLDVYLDGNYVRSLQMPSRENVRGGFGLITGTGSAYFQNIRLLARDPHDPAARIERELAMERVASGETQRQPGNFSGIEPPALSLGDIIQGPAHSLESLKGRPAAIVFWAPYQDKLIPTTAYYAHLASKWNELGIQFQVVVSGQHLRSEVEAWLEQHPMKDLPIAMDGNFKTYQDYCLSAEGHGLPRLILLDVDGTVAWEGDPGFRLGQGWHPGDSDTFFDGALANLVEQRHLRKLVELTPLLESSQNAFDRGMIRKAIETIQPLAELDASWATEVRQARNLLAKIESAGNQLPTKAREFLELGYPLTAEAILARGATGYAGTPAGELCNRQLKDLQSEPLLRTARKTWKALQKAVDDAERGRSASSILKRLDAAKEIALSPQGKEAHQALYNALMDSGPAGILKSWDLVQPDPTTDTAP